MTLFKGTYGLGMNLVGGGSEKSKFFVIGLCLWLLLLRKDFNNSLCILSMFKMSSIFQSNHFLENLLYSFVA